jgi:hypothetical protein
MAAWHHLVCIAGTARYPCFEDRHYSSAAAVAALDRVVAWCDNQTTEATAKVPPDLGDALAALKIIFRDNPISDHTDGQPLVCCDYLLQKFADLQIPLIDAEKLIDYLIGIGVFIRDYDPLLDNPPPGGLRDGTRLECDLRSNVSFPDGADLGGVLTPARRLAIDRAAWERLSAAAPNAATPRHANGYTIAQGMPVEEGGRIHGDIYRSHPLPRQSEAEHRRAYLQDISTTIGAWRAEMDAADAKPPRATDIAYLANAYARELWPETAPLSEGETFLPRDVRPMLDDLRNRILNELNRNQAGNKPAAQAPPGPIKSVTPPAKSRVVLRGQHEPPLIDDQQTEVLTRAQYDVVRALLDAFPDRLTKDQLDKQSKRGDARKIMKRLADSDLRWQAVLLFGGRTGGGYGIR